MKYLLKANKIFTFLRGGKGYILKEIYRKCHYNFLISYMLALTSIGSPLTVNSRSLYMAIAAKTQSVI
jgi:hypothetical protein